MRRRAGVSSASKPASVSTSACSKTSTTSIRRSETDFINLVLATNMKEKVDYRAVRKGDRLLMWGTALEDFCEGCTDIQIDREEGCESSLELENVEIESIQPAAVFATSIVSKLNLYGTRMFTGEEISYLKSMLSNSTD